MNKEIRNFQAKVRGFKFHCCLTIFQLIWLGGMKTVEDSGGAENASPHHFFQVIVLYT